MENILINKLKKGESFLFNGKTFIVKQKHADWRNNGEPFLKTNCGEIFYYGELEVKLSSCTIKHTHNEQN